MLEKGFWFKSLTDKTVLEKVNLILEEEAIACYPPVIASVLEPVDSRYFLRLVDELCARQLITEHYTTQIFTFLHRCSQIVFRDTYERISPTSFLTREDVLVIMAENVGIPIKLSLAHSFIEVKDEDQFEWARNRLAAYGIQSDEPQPLPLKKHEISYKAESIRYIGKQEVFSLSVDAG